MYTRRIIFIAQHSQASGEVVKTTTTSLRADFESPDCGVLEILVHICWVEENFEHVLHNSEKDWQHLQTVDVDKDFISVQQTAEANNAKLGPTLLADHLHNLADGLPYAGCMVEVIFVQPFNTSSEMSVMVLGACLRLNKWHGTQVTLLVARKDQENETCQLWKTVLHADIQNIEESISLKIPVWRGTISIQDKKSVMQSEVSLECLDLQQMKRKMNSLLALERNFLTEVFLNFFRRTFIGGLMTVCRDQRLVSGGDGGEAGDTLVLGPTLEMLACVSLHTVPLFLLDSLTLRVHVKENSPFGALLSSLSYTEGVVVKLGVFDMSSVPPAAAQGLSTMAWKEAASSGSYRTERERIVSKHHLFLIVRGRWREADHYTGLILRSPSEISAKLFEDLHLLAYFRSKIEKASTDTREEVEPQIHTFLDNLPAISADLFKDVDDIWMKMGLEEARVNTIELRHVAQQAQNVLLKKAIKTWKDISHSDAILSQSHVYCDMTCEPSKWPERARLIQDETKTKVLSRYQSSDSMTTSSSPLLVDESSVDAKDMARWFRPDGSAICDTFSPVKALGNRRKLSSKEAITLPWPECKDIHYHDVFYEHDKHTERQEHFFKKFRDVIMMEEFHSTFDNHPHIPAVRHRATSARSLGARPRMHRKTELMEERKICTNADGDSKDNVMGTSGIHHLQRTRSKSALLSSTLPLWHRPAKDTRHLVHQEYHQISSSVPPPRQAPDTVHIFTPSSVRKTSQASDTIHVFPPSSLSPLRRRSQAGDAVNIFAPSSLRKVPRTTEAVNIFTTPKIRHSSGDVRERQDNSGRQELRSQRHQRKLEEVLARVLQEAGVSSSDLIYSSCFQKLCQVTKFYVKQLPNSKNLKNEMRNIALKQVEQVVDLERRRQDLAMKKKLRPSTILCQ